MKNKLLFLVFAGLISISAYSQFTDITSTVGGITSTTNMGKPQVFDLNNDNYPDFLVPVLTSVSSPYTKYWRLYKNNGNSTFSDATTSYGLPTNLSLSTLGFIDYNGDRFKDLYFYTATGLKIFKNNNGTSFTEVTTQLGISNSFFTTGEITASLKVFDYDIDGDEDLLYTRTVAGVNTLTAIVNNGTTFSTKVNILTSIPGATTGGMNFSIFDMDNDGDFDLLFDAFSINSQYSNGIISLFRKDTTGYTNVTNTSGLVNGLPGQISTIDINQDGKLDIVKGGADCCSSPLYRVFIGNGAGIFTEQTSTYAISNGGYKYSPTIADFDNDTDFDFSWSSYTSTGAAPFRLYANNANVFTETAATYGLNFGVTSGGVPIDDYGNGVWMDIDKDGDLDIILNREGVGSTSTTGNVWIKRNPLQGNYINIKLNGCGVNKSGIGSKIKLVIGNTAKYLYYENSTDGNNSNGTDIFHFGLGNATLINSITVYWPNNTTTVLNNVGANQFLTIGAGASGSYAPTGNSNQILCAGSTVANLMVTGTNIQWYSASTGGTALAQTTVLANGATYYASQLVNGCQESARFAVTVSLNNPTVTASATTICRGSSVSIIASDGNNLTPTNNRVAQFSNNVSNMIGISYNSQSIPTNNFTYEFWFNTNRTISLLSEKTGGVSVQAVNGQNFAVIPDFYNIPYYRGTGVSVGTNGISVIEHSGNFIDARLTHATSLVGWHHCAVVYQNNTFKLYLDGSLIGSRSNGQNFGGYGTQYSNVGLIQTIGKGYPGYDANDNYTGKLDEYRQWSVALNATQINQIFNRKLQSINMAQCNLNLTFDQNTVINNNTIPSGIILTNTSAPTFATDNSFQVGGFIGNSIYNITNTNINTTITSTYLWSTGATTATINVTPNQTTQYWVDVTTNGVTCRKFITITVEWPVVANQSIITCSRSSVGFNFNSGSSSSIAPASYNVVALNLNGLTVMAGNPQVANGLLATDLADDAFANSTNLPVNVTYTVVPVSPLGCLGNPFTITVTVNPEPVVANQSIITCNNTPIGVNFNASFSVAAATYNVIALNLNGLTVSSGNPQVANGLLATDLVNDAFANSTNVPVNVIYTVVPVSATGCIGNPFTITVTVNPGLAPTGNSNQTFCSGATVANLMVTGTDIQWYASNTGGTPLASNTVLVNGTTYFASQTAGGCVSSTRLAVTVSLNNPTVTASATTVCSETAVTLTASTTENSLTCNLPSNLQNGLVGYWPFCGNAIDASGNNNNGTVNGATLTTDRFGNVNSAYSFDGVNDYIRVNNSSSLNNQSFSISGWFNTNVLASNDGNGAKGIIGKWWQTSSICNSNYDSYLVCLTKPVSQSSTFMGGATDLYAGNEFYSNTSITTNSWYHFVFSHNSNSGGKLYLNGVLINSNNLAGAICNSINDVNIGADITNGNLYRFFNGKLDELGIWNRALNQQEIAQLYNNIQTTYLWSTGATTATINVTPSQTTQYWVDVTTNGVTCRKFITITVNSTTTAPTGNANQTLCAGATIADLTATGTNIQWYTASTGGIALVSTAVLANGTTYYASQTASNCESSTRLAVTVSLNNSSVSASATTLCSGQSTTLTASSGASSTNNFTVGSIGPAGGYVFYDQGSVINGWRYLEASPTDNGSDSGTGCYCVSIPNTSNLVGTGKVNTTNWINAGCNGYWFNLTQSLSINGLTNWFIPSKDELNLMYVNLKQNNLGNFQNVPYWTSSPASYGSCGINGGAWVQNFTNGTQNSEYRSGYQGAGNLRLVRQFASGIPLSTYLWSTGETSATINVTPTQTTQYWVDVTTNGVTCRKYITITVVPATPAPTGANNQTMTQGSTLANLVSTGQNIVWYATPFGGSPLPANTPLVNGVTYYASQTINGCESEFRLPVIVQISLSNDDFNSISIVYSPNPVTDILSVRASIDLKTAKICNMLGQTVLQQNFDSNEIHIDMSNLPTGTYLVIVESDNRKETFKIVKK